MSVTLLQVIAAAQRRHASLAGEMAGYLVLGAADLVAGGPRRLTAPRVLLEDGGTLSVLATEPSDALACEHDLRELLSDLLRFSRTAPPPLRRSSERPARGDVGLLVRELEAALIPVNRAAGRRALARLHRETRRAISLGLSTTDEDPVPLHQEADEGVIANELPAGAAPKVQAVESDDDPSGAGCEPVGVVDESPPSAAMESDPMPREIAPVATNGSVVLGDFACSSCDSGGEPPAVDGDLENAASQQEFTQALAMHRPRKEGAGEAGSPDVPATEMLVLERDEATDRVPSAWVSDAFWMEPAPQEHTLPLPLGDDELEELDIEVVVDEAAFEAERRGGETPILPVAQPSVPVVHTPIMPPVASLGPEQAECALSHRAPVEPIPPAVTEGLAVPPPVVGVEPGPEGPGLEGPGPEGPGPEAAGAAIGDTHCAGRKGDPGENCPAVGAPEGGREVDIGSACAGAPEVDGQADPVAPEPAASFPAMETSDGSDDEAAGSGAVDGLAEGRGEGEELGLAGGPSGGDESALQEELVEQSAAGNSATPAPLSPDRSGALGREIVDAEIAAAESDQAELAREQAEGAPPLEAVTWVPVSPPVETCTPAPVAEAWDGESSALPELRATPLKLPGLESERHVSAPAVFAPRRSDVDELLNRFASEQSDDEICSCLSHLADEFSPAAPVVHPLAPGGGRCKSPPLRLRAMGAAKSQ